MEMISVMITGRPQPVKTGLWNMTVVRGPLAHWTLWKWMQGRPIVTGWLQIECLLSLISSLSLPAQIQTKLQLMVHIYHTIESGVIIVM